MNSLSHAFYHWRRDRQLWRLQIELCQGVRTDVTPRQEGELCLQPMQKKHLPQVQELHKELCGQPLLPWLYKAYCRCPQELGSVITDKDGRVIAYDLFMFNEAEVNQNLIHEQYLGVAREYQGKGLAVKLRRYSLSCYNHGKLRGASTLAFFHDIKALRTAQQAGYAIVSQSAKPPAHYLVQYFSQAAAG